MLQRHGGGGPRIAVVLPVRCGLHLSVPYRRGPRLEVLGDYMSVDSLGCAAGFDSVVFVAWANSKPGGVSFGVELCDCVDALIRPVWVV